VTATAPLRHLLDVDDLTPDELTGVLDLAERPMLPRVLAGRGVALLFEKPSLRTRHSTELAVVELGGHPVSDQTELGRRETIPDMARTLCGYHAAIGARVFAHTKVAELARWSTVPVVNMLSDDAHPLQALADLLTLRQEFGALAGIRVAWVGDFSNVARSLAKGLALSGASMVCACPPGFGPSAADVEAIAVLGGRLGVADRPDEAVVGAAAVVTDAWYSMGQEADAVARKRAFEGYTVTAGVMAAAADGAVFLHCLPAHRGEEVTDEVLDGPASRVFPEAWNRRHTARAALAFCLGVRA
jgi:ornithine carbamoyltransferase